MEKSTSATIYNIKHVYIYIYFKNHDEVFVPQGQGSLVGCCLWGHTELDMTEAT